MLKYEYHNLLASKQMLSILPKDKIFDSEHQVKNIHEEMFFVPTML